ncbi:MAG TPA: choice-of-anchor Q domain-containing protein [Myxococcaceae bacterium]|nr:choice-of-anchor Q domain-containing protein [Myxococcaceae bacterium]
MAANTHSPAQDAERSQRRTHWGVLLTAAMLSACTYQVDSTADSVDANPGDDVCKDAQGRCTLRAAIMEANAKPSAERIELPAGTYRLTLPAAQGGGPLVIENSVTLRGASASSTVIDAAAVSYDGGQGCPASGPERRVLLINGGTVALSYLTLQGGLAQNGGGIYVDRGQLEITDAVIRRNVAFTGGGGLLNRRGVVRVRRTSVVENCAVGAFGGGLNNQSNGELWVYESLIARNHSNRAGGIRNDGQLNLRSTTVSGNYVDSPSAGTGGISQNGFAVLNSVTVANNVGIGTDEGSFRGGGIQTSSGRITVVKNTIIASNDGKGGPNDCVGQLTSDSRHNLIGDTQGCSLPALTTSYLLNVDPQLGALAFNGGPTQTHALLKGSPARESAYAFPPPAADACEAHDQRGVPRPQGKGRCDMGAFEADNANVFVTGFVLVDADTDADLFPLREGEFLNLADLPPRLSVRADVSGSVGSVVFALDANEAFRTENNAPYALGGDAPLGNYTPVAIPSGIRTLRATPFAGANGTGAAGGSLKVQFLVIN